LAVVVQVIDNVWVFVSAIARVNLVTNIIVEVCTEMKLDPGHASGRFLDSLRDVVVGDSGFRGAGHVENGRRDRKTCVEVQDADGKNPRLHA
jgi:hypothetical protein